MTDPHLAAYAKGLEDAARECDRWGADMASADPAERTERTDASGMTARFLAMNIRALSPRPPGYRAQAARIAELEAEVARLREALAAAESWIVDGGYCDARDPCVAESAGFVVAEIRAALALRALTGGDDR